MSVTFKTFRKVVKRVIEGRHPVLVRGRHGIGKSEVIKQIAKDHELAPVERRASQMTEGDLMGLPLLDGDSTSWNPPDWYKDCCENARLLFLDEVDRGSPEVCQGLFELCDSRKLNGHKLHPDTLIFAAINGGKHGQQYQVRTMDPAENDRYTIFDLDPSVDDWLDWASLPKLPGSRATNIHPIIWNFINQNHGHLEHKDNFEPNEVYPSRRSWKRFSDTCVRGDLIEAGKTNDEVYVLASAYLGLEAASAFQAYVASYKYRISADDLLAGKIKPAQIKKLSINEHNSLIDELSVHKALKRKMTQGELDALGEYFVRIPAEVARRIVEVYAIPGNYLDNSTEFCKVNTSKGKVTDRLVSIVTGAVFNDDGDEL
jgi:hypothetical protein